MVVREELVNFQIESDRILLFQNYNLLGW